MNNKRRIEKLEERIGIEKEKTVKTILEPQYYKLSDWSKETIVKTFREGFKLKIFKAPQGEDISQYTDDQIYDAVMGKVSNE